MVTPVRTTVAPSEFLTRINALSPFSMRRARASARHQIAYVRFTLSFRDVEDLLAERGIVVSYETVRRWVNHFGPKIAADLRKRRPKPHTNWHVGESVPRRLLQ